MEKVIMKCGHTAQSKDKNGNPVCVICFGIVKGATEKAKQPNLIGRESKCCYCGKKEKSSNGLPFFEYCPDNDYDKHYCGCRGWD